jgi:hypothetical protein
MLSPIRYPIPMPPTIDNQDINDAIKAKDVLLLEQYLEYYMELCDTLDSAPKERRTYRQKFELRNARYQADRIGKVIKLFNNKLMVKTKTTAINNIDAVALGAYIGSLKAAAAATPRQPRNTLSDNGRATIATPLAPQGIDKYFEMYEALVLGGMPDKDAWEQSQRAKFNDSMGFHPNAVPLDEEMEPPL